MIGRDTKFECSVSRSGVININIFFLLCILQVLIQASHQTTSADNLVATLPPDKTSESSTPAPPPAENSRLSKGEIIGISLAATAIVVTAFCAYPGWKLARKQTRDRRNAKNQRSSRNQYNQVNTDLDGEDHDPQSIARERNNTLTDAATVTSEINQESAELNNRQDPPSTREDTEQSQRQDLPTNQAGAETNQAMDSQPSVDVRGNNNRVFLMGPGSILNYGQAAAAAADGDHLEDLKLADLIKGKKIASGSFSEVFEVTFKKGSFRGHSKAAAKKINQINQREVNILMSVSHLHIVTLLGYVDEAFANLLVMELAEKTLRKYLDEHKSTIPRQYLEKWVRDICHAIEYLHGGVLLPDGSRMPVVHRNIKASNCLLFEDDNIPLLKLADFSIAREADYTIATKTGKGSLPWTAPEVRSMNSFFSLASDIFGLGVLFWEISTQENPRAQTDINPHTWNQPSEPDYLVELLPLCWKEDHRERPTIKQIIDRIPHVAGGDETDESGFLELQKADMIQGAKIGDGGYGEVFEVTFRQGSFRGHYKAAAKKLKKIHPPEIEILKCVRHPHIVKLLAYVDEEFVNMLVMELADQNLRQYLDDNKGRVSEPLKARWVHEVCSAVDYLHDGVVVSNGRKVPVIHRDIKASNCLLFGGEDTLCLKIADFSISKQTDHTTGTNTGKGSMPWKAPELRQAEPQFSPASDIYSLGLLMWEIYTQEDPARKQSFGVNDTFPEYFKNLLPHCWREDYRERPTIKEVMERIP